MARTVGAKNKQTLDVKELAQDYTEEAVKALAKVMRASESDAAVVAAARELLDRGHGKAKQVVGGEGEGAAILHRIESVIVRPSDPNR